MPLSNLPPDLWTAIKQLIIGGAACGAHYLYMVARGIQEFMWVQFLLNICIGGFVGWMVGEFLFENTGASSNFWVAVSGISAFQIMEFIENKPKDLLSLINKFKK